jgi:hypothetical protein
LTAGSRYETFLSHLKSAKIEPRKEVLERIVEYHYCGIAAAASDEKTLYFSIKQSKKFLTPQQRLFWRNI